MEWSKEACGIHKRDSEMCVWFVLSTESGKAERIERRKKNIAPSLRNVK